MPDEPFGITFASHWGRDNQARRDSAIAKQIGIDWDRWPFPWHVAEPNANGHFEWEAGVGDDNVDFINGLNLDDGAGLKVIGVLDGAIPVAYYTPDGQYSIEGLELDPFLPDGTINPENRWARYVWTVTTNEQLAGKVDAWEIINEFNLVHWDDPMRDKTYRQALDVTCQVLDRTGSGKPVFLGGPEDRQALLAAKTRSGFYWDVLEYAKTDLSDCIDGISLHSFGNPRRSPYLIEKRDNLWPGKPMWFTEAGLQHGTAYFPFSGEGCGTPWPCGTEEHQASYVIQHTLLTWQALLAANVEGKVFHHSFMDGPHGNNPAEIWGLLDAQGNELPAKRATEFIFGLLQGAEFWSSQSGTDASGNLYKWIVFETSDGRIVNVMWATGFQAATVEFESHTGNLVEEYDQEGNLKGSGDAAFTLQLPPTDHDAVGSDTAPEEPFPGKPMLGGPPVILIESREESRAPQGGAELVCENGQLVGTRLWGYDEHTGLDEFSYIASPEKTYDLSWTQPGIVYGGVFRQVPPVGGTAILTLTNKSGLFIVQELFHPADICKDDDDNNGGGTGPGGDHPDDNHSAASPPIPAGEFFALPEGARVPPRVAILNRGSSHSLWQMALQLGETAISIGSDFDPVATAQTYPVFLIPSGGLYGLENSPSFRARLEEYARLGGVIVAFSQQHGYEYGALPGGEIGGYGWNEDISCFRSSLYLSEWHPVLSGFDRATLDVHVDGYFDAWPSDAHIMLSRRVNGQPGVILYPYGEGWVFATTMYDDWGVGHGQSSQDARTLLRDLLSWAITPDDLPQFAPGDSIVIDIPITNTAAYTATAVSLRLVDPARQIALTRTLPVTIPAGGAASVPFTTTAATPLGLWRIDVTLFSGQFAIRNSQFAIAFIVADPAEPVDLAPEISLNVTAPAYRFIYDTGATFTFIARNDSAVTQTLELQYGLPHHTWRTHDSSYGNFYDNHVSLTIPPHGEAYHYWPRIIRAPYDRLWARLVRDGQVVAKSHFGVFGGAQRIVSISASADPDTVQRTGVTTLDLSVFNKSGAPLTATLHIRAVDAAHTIYHTATLTTPLATDPQPPETLAYSFTVPADAAVGTGHVWVEARDPDGRAVGGTLIPLSVPASSLAFAHLPFPPLVGESTVFPSLVVTNTSSILPVEGGVVTYTLSLPDGNVISTTTFFTLDLSSSRALTVPLTLPPLTFGRYRLVTEVGDEYGTRQLKTYWWAYPLVKETLDQPTYRAGDTARLGLRLINRDSFVLPLTATLQSPNLPYSHTQLLTLEPYATLTLTRAISIPPDVAAGSYPLTLTLTLPGGDARVRELAPIQAPPSALTISGAPPTVNVGQTIYLTLTNTGGASTLASYDLALRDQRGWSVGSFQDDAIPVLAGGGVTLTLSIPDQAATGGYVLGGAVTDGSTGQETSLHTAVHVTGLETSLAAATDREVYLTGDSITVTGVLTHTGAPLVDGSLTMRIVQEMPEETEWTVYNDDNSGLVNDTVTTVAFDSQSNKWFGTDGHGLSVLSGITWTTYTQWDEGDHLASNYVSALAVDPADNVWVGTDGAGLSVRWAADGSWTTYTSEGDLVSDYVRAVAADSQGNVWCGHGSGGVSVRWATSGDWETFDTENSGLGGGDVFAIAIDSADNVWFGHGEDGVSVRWAATGDWQRFTTEDGLAGPYVTGIGIDASDNVWIGHQYDGLSVRWAASGEWDTSSTDDGLYSDEITAIAADASGNVWIGHPYDGLSVRWASDSTWPHYTAADGLAGDEISAVAVDPEGSVWVGHNGSGVTAIGEAATKKPRPSTRWKVFTTDDGLASDDVRGVAVGPDNAKWFATADGASRLSPGDSTWDNYYPPDLAGYDVRAVAVDGGNNKWFATADGASRLSADGDWTTYTDEDGLTSNDVRDVALDGQGNPWFGTDYGLSVYRVLSDTWTTYTAGDGLADDYVSAVAVAPDGDVWVGHPWSGVSRFSGGVWTTYGYGTLVSEDVDEIAVAPTGEVWVGTYDGISVYSPAGDTWTNYPRDDTPWLGDSVTAIAFEPDGDAWIGFEYAGAVWRAADGSEWQAYDEADGLGNDQVRGIALDRMGNVWFATEGYGGGGSYHRSVGLACPARQSSGGAGGVTRYRPGGRRVLWLETTTASAGGALPAVAIQEWALAASSLGVTGKLTLEGELYAASGQALAADRQPFYVFDTATALIVNPDRAVYRPGQAATVTGEVRNGSPTALLTQTLIVRLGEEQATVGPFDVPAGDAYPYTVILAAPDAEGAVSLSAAVGDVFVQDTVTVAAPALAVALNAPDVTGRAAFDLFVELENPSLLDTSIEVTISTSDPGFAIRHLLFVIPAGEIRTLVETYAISADTVFTVSITGDITRTLTHAVTFGEAAEVVLLPQSIYPEGIVSIPYTLTNTGQLPTVVDLEIGGFEIQRFDTYLPVGAVASGDLFLDLTPGDYTLVYTTPFDGGVETFHVVPAEATELSATVGPRAGSVVTVTATVTNTGFYPLTGALRLETPFFITNLPIYQPTSPPIHHTLPLDTAAAAPGPYTATVTLLSGSGASLASSVVSITVPGADLVLTTVPTGAVVQAGQWVTLTFGVANQGSAPATAIITVTLGDLLDEARSLWLPGGASDTMSFSFRAPDGLSAESLAGVFWFEGQRYDLVLDVAGVDLDVSAEWDQSVYDPGATATLRITVTNQAVTAAPPLYAVVAYHDQTITQPLTLLGGATVALDFALTADAEADGKVFYGIYEANEQRGIHLNTTYLYLLNPDVTIVPDRHVYYPGDTVHAAVYAAATGTLTVTAPGFTTTLVLTGDNTEFQFILPTTLLRGTYFIDYVLDGGLPRSAPFDVDAVWVRVTEARLLDLPYAPGDTVQADLTIASTAPTEAAVLAWLRYPNGTRSAETVDAVSLQDVLNNHVSLTLPLSTTQAGSHRLVYLLADPADHDRVYAAGSEAFDVGPATLQGLRTDRETYPDPAEPIVAEITVYADRATAAELALTPDGGTGWVYSLDLVTGTQTLTFSLPVLLNPGSHSLEATLTAAGLDSTARTGFLYGTDAADLTISAPRIADSTGGLTRTVEILVHNRGGFPAVSTTLQLWDGEPGVGTLLGEEPVPALEAGEMIRVYFDWDILGQGGSHTLHTVVDPAGQVAEFFEENNTTSTRVTLPSFALQVETDRGIYTAGDAVTITVRTTNLMSAELESLALTTTAEYVGWLQVFQDTSALELEPLEQETVQLTWDTADLLGGDYTIRARGVDQDGERGQALATVQIYDLGNFSASPLTGTAPLTVTFSDLSAPLGEVDSWRWDFGDGSPLVTETNSIHVYETAGLYTVTLTTTVGISTYVEIKPGYITVLPGEEQPPQVDAGLDRVANEGDVVAFSGTIDDPDTPTGHDITWDLGDGATASGTLTPTHTFADDGIYLVTLTVTDTSGLGDSDFLTVTVDNVSPDVDAGPNQVADEDEQVTFAGTFSDSGGLDTHIVEWDLGDGDMATDTLTPTHTYVDPGVYTVTLTITDDDGGAGSDTLTVTVNPVNDPPVAADDSATTDEDTAVTIDVLANDDDVDGDSLSIDSVTQPANGTATNNTADATYTPDVDYCGSDSFTYTASDGVLTDTATVNVTVICVNDAPVAADDTETTNEDTVVTIDVLDNDSDVDGDSLSVESVTQSTNGTATNNTTNVTYTPDADYCGSNSFSYTVSDGVMTDTATVNVTVICVNDAPVAADDSETTNEDTAVTVDVLTNDDDVDGDALSVDSVTQPTNGTVINNTTDVTYEPDADYCGDDGFTYIVSDGVLTDTATVNVTVACVNDAPLAADDSADTDEDTAVTVDVLDNDDDVDGDSLSVDSVTQPANGTATNNITDVTYEPDADYCGSDSFTYTASDGVLTDTATVNVTVICVNDAPVAANDTETTNEDTVVTIDVLANDTDVDGDSLSIESLTQPANGSVINNTTDVTYTPDADYCGSDSFIYTVSDGVMTDTATVNVTVSCVNDAPVAADDSETTNEDTAVTIDVLTNDDDVDGDSLSVESVTQPANGTVTNNNTNVTYTPDADYCGSDSFTYVVSDGVMTDTAVVNVTVTCVNDAPVAADDSETTNEDTAVTVDVLANDDDVDGDSLSVDSVTQPTNGTVTNNTTNVTYTPDADYCGSDNFTYVASDGILTDTATVNVTVTCVNDAPVAADDSETTDEDTAVTIDVLDNDGDVDGDSLSVESVTQPTNGTATNNTTDVTYEPDTDYCGSDSFTYVVSDGILTDTATVNVTVTCVNDAPVAADDSETTDEDTAVAVDVLANDSDVDSNTLTVDSVTQPANGTVTNNTTDVTYTPDADYCGSDSFTYVVSDGILTDTATVDVTVTCVNDAPQVEAGPDQAVDEGDTVSFTGFFADPDGGDTHTITWSFGDGYTATGALTPTHTYADDGIYIVILTVTDADGDVGSDTLIVTVDNVAPFAYAGLDWSVDEGEGVLFNGSFIDPGTVDTHTIHWDFGDSATANGTLNPTHAYADNGTYTVTLTVTDDDGGTDSDTLLVTVSNVAPTVDAGPDQTVDEGEEVNFGGSFTDPGSADTHTIHWDFGDGATTDGTLNPTHTYTESGVYTVTLTVTDDDGGAGSDILVVTVNEVAMVCELYPIALHEDTLAGAAVGDELANIYNGADPGNFGWLSWTGDPDVPTLVQSLTPPGDSYTYVNPNDPDDDVLTTGDWVYGKPGVSNAKAVRDALDTLKDIVITVPVWDQTTGEGNHADYHVVGFARVQITDYHLPKQNRISAVFWGDALCEAAPPASPPAGGGDTTPITTSAPVTESLQVLYTFQEGSGVIIQDVSDVGVPLNLEIDDVEAVRWLPDGGLAVDAPVLIASSSPATKVVEAAQSTGELTLEMWVRPANTTQDGPARLVTLSQNAGQCNFTLGQGLWGSQPPDVYDVRLRTTDTDDGGAPSVTTPAGSVTTDFDHVVYTRDTSDLAHIYVNGVAVISETVGGDFSNWEGYRLALANELTKDRPWLGELHRLAIYDRALTSDEVNQNYDDGLSTILPSPTPPPTSTPPPAPTPVPTNTRVTENLQALYTFQEGNGATVHDVSEVGAPLDLEISDAGAVSWLPGGGLAVEASTVIASDDAATKVIDASRATDELTIEAWAKPANAIQDGPARLVTLSKNAKHRNFTLGQGLWGNQPSDVYDVRLRTTATSKNGVPSVTTPEGTLTTELAHIVYTRGADGVVRIYVDGVQVANATVDGDFSNWVSNHRLGLANELTQDQPWLGELYLVGIYNRALTPAEVSQNYDAGLD